MLPIHVIQLLAVGAYVALPFFLKERGAPRPGWHSLWRGYRLLFVAAAVAYWLSFPALRAMLPGGG